MLEKELYRPDLVTLFADTAKNMHSSAIGTHYTSLSSSCSLPKIHCQTSFICTVTDELSEVSPSILVFASYQLHAHPANHPSDQSCAVRAFSDFISNGRNANSDGEAGGFISPTSKSSFHVAHRAPLYAENTSFPCCIY